MTEETDGIPGARRVNITVGPILRAEWAVIEDPKDSGLPRGTLMLRLEGMDQWLDLESMRLHWGSYLHEKYDEWLKGRAEVAYLETLGDLREEKTP